MRHPLVAFAIRFVLSAASLWVAVAAVSPGNPANTFARAAIVSLVLSVAFYVTLAKFLWFLLLPWLLYAFVWVGVVMGAYGIGFLRALLLGIVLTFLSWVVEVVVGVKTFRSS